MQEFNPDFLFELGLSKNESEVYLALLGLGSASVSDIAVKVKVHRVNIYDALKRLGEKGLVASVVKSNKQYFEPAAPTEIDNMINRKKSKLVELQSKMPDLHALFNQEKSKQSVHHFIGKKGLITAYNNIIENLSDSEMFYSIGSTGVMRDVLPEYTKQFVRRTNEKNIKAKILYYHTAKTKKKFPNMDVKYIPQGMEFIPMTIYLHNGFVTIVSFEPMLAIEIQSVQIYENYLKYANWLWSISEE
ncbi:MAG: TrmB family transcriptional regulator [Candidatus Woesearchaeota archaeon]